VSTVVSRAASRVVKQASLETLKKALAEKEEKLAATQAEIAKLTAEEDAAVAEAIHEHPTKSAYGVGMPAEKLRQKRRQLAATVEGLENEIPLVRAEIHKATAVKAGEALQAATENAKRLTKLELEARRKAGEKFAEFVDAWNEVADLLSERSALCARVQHEKLIETAGFFGGNTAQAWEREHRFPIEPVATSLRTLIDEVLEATTSHTFRSQVDEDDEALAEANRERKRLIERAGSGGHDAFGNPLWRVTSIPSPPTKRTQPSQERLVELTPDLRGKVKEADVSQNFAPRLGDRGAMPAGWGGLAPGFGNGALPSVGIPE
jgi:hypothetical protein